VRHRLRARIAVVYAAFFLSGFTSLVLEVVWSKALGFTLGSTLHAVSTVIAVYLGGLALGAYAAGRLAPRLTRPILGYGMLEVGIGVYALVSLALLRALEPLIGVAYAGPGADSTLYVVVRASVSGLVLLPPTVLMGATLPWLVAWAGSGGSSFGRELARLYGINTLGAVAGVVVAGFGLVPFVGLAGSARLAGLLALTLGVGLILFGLRGRPVPAAQSAPTRTTAPKRAPRRAWAVLLFGLSGAVALTLEITWTRVFGLIFGSSVYSFSLVLAAYLLGVALGSTLWGGRLAEGARPWRAFGLLQAGLAAGVVAGLWLLPELPLLFMATLLASREQLGVVYLTQAGLAGLVVLLPCLALGALFPVGARLLGRAGDSGSRATGLAYAVNTAGTIAGSLLAGFVLLPRAGVQASLVGATLVALALGAAAILNDAAGRPIERGGRSATRWSALFLTATLLFAVAALLAPRWDRALFTLGVYRHPGSTLSWGQALRTARAEIERTLERELLLFYEEGLHSVVSVHGYRDQPRKRTLRVNGKPDAGTGDDMATQIMLGHLPMLWAPPQARVCVIGLGSGVTARAALAHDPLSVTVVEIERGVVDAARWFDDVSERVLDDPRVELVLEDGRTHLQHSGRRYDMIVSEPSNPWIAGVNNLFTTDFYRRVRSALTPEGVFCQWVQFYALSQRAMASLLGSFAEVFPQGEAFLFERDLLLIAPPTPSFVPGERLRLERRALEPVAAYLARFDLHADGYVASRHLARVAHLAEQLPTAPLNTDDRPFVEYRAPFDLYRIAPDETLDVATGLAEPDPLEGLARWVEEADLTRVATAAGIELARIGRESRAEALAVGLARRGAVDAANAVTDAAQRGAAARRVETTCEAAGVALESGDLDHAELLLAGVFEVDPNNVAAHLLAGRAAMRRENLEQARGHLELVRGRGDPRQRSVALNNLGIVEMREGRAQRGLTAFEAARASAPGAPASYLNLARWSVETGDAEAARRWLEDGLRRAYPPWPIEQALQALAEDRPF